MAEEDYKRREMNPGRISAEIDTIFSSIRDWVSSRGKRGKRLKRSAGRANAKGEEC